ncbi:hypothetical protein ElyMa_002149600 [Elysia marginata]|uniref:Uncharacterized protein n=1 Tax=Elysia marginata TaxID=1093978 RepID=A0AAV4FKI4_9GAST|nr:hypothetical protein ElyMa_002149600 [Elysia marginata]
MVKRWKKNKILNERVRGVDPESLQTTPVLVLSASRRDKPPAYRLGWLTEQLASVAATAAFLPSHPRPGTRPTSRPLGTYRWRSPPEYSRLSPLSGQVAQVWSRLEEGGGGLSNRMQQRQTTDPVSRLQQQADVTCEGGRLGTAREPR